MERRSLDDFRFILVTLDKSSPPPFFMSRIYLDFSDSDGTLTFGANLLRLIYGIVDKRIPPLALRFASDLEENMRVAGYAIRAALNAGNHKRLLELAGSNSGVWK